MNKTYLRWILIMIMLPVLGGCASFFKTFEVKKSDEKKSDEKKNEGIVKPYFVTQNISDAETKNKKEEKLAVADGPEKVKLYPGTGVFVNAPVPPVASVAKPATGDEMMLNFEGADLREVVKAIVGDIFNETYIIDPKVQGVINLHTSSPLQRKDLLPTLETLLRMNGAAIIREEGIYKVVPAATATRGSITPQLGDDKVILQGGRGYSVQIAPLKFIAAKEMVKILEPFVTEANAVRIDEARNLIILSGTERELKHLQDTIAMFDVDWLSGMSVALFTLQSVDVKTAVADLNKIFGAQALSPLAGVVKLIPIERLNAILVITQQPKYLEQAKIWIERLDHTGGTAGGMRLFVYPVQNGMAEKLAALLNNVFSKSPASTSLPPALAPGLAPAEVKSTEMPADATPEQQAAAGDSVAVKGDVRVLADKDNNALLILASPANYEKIETAIRKLDVPPRQVLIDVTIAEITLTGDLKFGLEWAFNNGRHGSGKLDTGSPGISALAPGFSYMLSNSNVVGGVAAALNLLATDSRVKVISSPHIMVTDNQTAKIQVGDRVPVTSQTQSVLGSVTGLIASIQYIDTGILLTVTPRINAGGQVTMEINQEVSAASITTTSSINSPTISKRAVKTTVVVKSGETMVLGGLITDNKTTASSGLPYLSKIPFIGGLFGAQTFANTRTELVLLITPRLVANNQQAHEVSEEFRKKLSGLGDLLENVGKSSDMPKKPVGLNELLQRVEKPGDIPKQMDRQVKQVPLLR